MPCISEKGDRLIAAFEAKDLAVGANLRPGLAREEIFRIVRSLKITLPDEVVELYEWRNGHFDEFDAERVLVFRDNTFISLQRAVKEYAAVQRSYGRESMLKSDRVDLRVSLPISAFEGAWDVVACGAHLFDPALDHPVIRVFQGITPYFRSISVMLDTCVDWVSSPSWRREGLPASEEMHIWQRHNPGIFSSRNR